MKIHALPMPLAGTSRATPLLLALASLAALAAGHALAPKLPPGTGTDLIPALDAWPAVAAAAIGIGARLAGSRTLSGGPAAAMTLSLLLAASAALLQALFATGSAAAISAVSAVVFLALALVALEVALVALAPGRVRRF